MRSWIWRAPPPGGPRGTGSGPGRTGRRGARAAASRRARRRRGPCGTARGAGPGAVALVHRVRVERGVLAQALVEARRGVVAQEGLVLGQHVPLLGVEQEDEPQEDGEQRPVDLVRVLGERLAEELALGRVVGGLEAAQQLVERVEHLLGEALADLVLVLAAVLEERGEALRAGQAQQSRLAEQQAQRGRDRPARRSGPCPRRGSRASLSSRRVARRGDEARGR